MDSVLTKIINGTPLIQQAMECQRVGIAVEGFSVHQVHIHLVPVNSVNELNPERAVTASPEQLTIVQNKICQVINKNEVFYHIQNL